MIYLDHAAATPLSPKAHAAMQPYWTDMFHNPSASYGAGKAVKSAIQRARYGIAQTIGAKQDEILFAAGATEANAMAISGVLKQFPEGSVVIADTEHAAVREQAKGYGLRLLAVSAQGRVDPGQLIDIVDDTTVLVSVAYAESELGTIQPIRDIAAKIHEIRANRQKRGVVTPIHLHTDASQAFGVLDCHVSRLGVDMMTINGAKCYGPKQTAALWVKSGVNLVPFLPGGGQESGIRSGTESVAQVVGFAAAAVHAVKKQKSEVARVGAMRDILQKKLLLSDIGELLTVNGHKKHRLPSHLHLSIQGVDAERLLYALDFAGILVSTGAACAANKQTRSHVLDAVGMSPAQADSSIRMTLGRLNDESQIDEIISIFVEVVKQERDLS